MSARRDDDSTTLIVEAAQERRISNGGFEAHATRPRCLAANPIAIAISQLANGDASPWNAIDDALRYGCDGDVRRFLHDLKAGQGVDPRSRNVRAHAAAAPADTSVMRPLGALYRRERRVEPNFEALKRLVARDAAAADRTARARRFRSLATPESRALEFALAAIETLRVRGVLNGAELCRLAILLGYDQGAIARAWKTRAEFDPDTVPYELDVPLARVLALD